jgi:mannosyltransferase
MAEGGIFLNLKGRWAGPVIVMAVAVVLRLIGLADRTIWYDDAFSLLLAAREMPDILAGTAADTMPPLYYLVLHAWSGLGTSLGWLRLFNVLMSLAVVVLVYVWGARWLGRPAGLFAALVVAISPVQIYHAQELRMYALLQACLLVCLLALFEIWQGAGGKKYWALVILGGTASLYTHNLAIFSLLAPAFLLAMRRDWGMLRRLVLAQLIMLSAAVPWLILIPGQVAKIQAAFWTPRPGMLEVVQALITAHTNLPIPEALLALAVGASLLSVALTGLALLRGLPQERTGRALEYLLVLAIVPPGLLFLASYIMRPLFVPRAFMLSMLAYALLAGHAVARLKPHFMRVVLALAMLVPAILVLPSQYTYRSFPRSPFGQAVDYLASRDPDPELILHDNKLSFFPMLVYRPDLPQKFLPDEPGSHNDTLAPITQQALEIYPAESLAGAVDKVDRVWFVMFSRARAEYLELGWPDHPVLLELETIFGHETVTNFNDLELHLFIR